MQQASITADEREMDMNTSLIYLHTTSDMKTGHQMPILPGSKKGFHGMAVTMAKWFASYISSYDSCPLMKGT